MRALSSLAINVTRTIVDLGHYVTLNERGMVIENGPAVGSGTTWHLVFRGILDYFLNRCRVKGP